MSSGHSTSAQLQENMAKYYVNKRPQSNGDHEVHKEGCQWMPSDANREYLGDYSSCAPAVAEAKKRYPTANGCATCSGGMPYVVNPQTLTKASPSLRAQLPLATSHGIRFFRQDTGLSPAAYRRQGKQSGRICLKPRFLFRDLNDQLSRHRHRNPRCFEDADVLLICSLNSAIVNVKTLG